jgi:hypothetical protein
LDPKSGDSASNKTLQGSHSTRKSHLESIFYVGFVPHRSDIDITADVAIPFNEPGDLINDNNPATLKSDDEKKNSFSVGAQLGHIAEWTASVDDL